MAARPRQRPAPETSRASTAPAPPGSTWVWAAPVVIALVAFAAYANSLGNGFVWDDPVILSRQLVVFRSVGDVLAPPRDIPQFSPDYYRPLTIASYLLDRAAGGEQPFAFHLSVVLAHTATSVLVYALVLQLLASVRRARLAAVIGGMLFAVHPIHSESVAWAAGRSDVLATAFLLAALLIHARRPTWGGSALAGLCAAAALGAKETAVALYPLMVLRDLLAPPAGRRHAADWGRAYSGPLVAGMLYVLLRRGALGDVVGSASPALPVGQRSLLDLAAAVGVYVEKLLWPVDLNAYIDHVSGGPLQLLFALLLAAALGTAAWRWSTTRADAVPLFALAWLALTLLPSLAIVWRIPDAPIAERYLYLPSVGFCMLVGVLAARAWGGLASRTLRLGLAAVIGTALLAATIGTVRRNPVWHDDIALWEDTQPKSQLSGLATRNLGTAYQQAGRAADARAAFEQALRRRNDPRGVQTIYNNLGTLAMYDGDYATAQRDYRQALAASPEAADTLFNLGLAVLQGDGQSPAAARAALPYYEHALRLSPHDSDIEAGLAQVFDLLGERAATVDHANRALALGARGPTADSLREILRRAGASPPP